MRCVTKRAARVALSGVHAYVDRHRGPSAKRSPMTTTHTQQQLPELLDITQLAQHLGVNVRHVRRLVAVRRIPFIKWGHLIRFDPAEIVEWLERNRRHI